MNLTEVVPPGNYKMNKVQWSKAVSFTIKNTFKKGWAAQETKDILESLGLIEVRMKKVTDDYGRPIRTNAKGGQR